MEKLILDIFFKIFRDLCKLLNFCKRKGKLGEKVAKQGGRKKPKGSTRGPQRGQKAGQEVPRADFGRIFEAKTVRFFFNATSMKKLISQKSLF